MTDWDTIAAAIDTATQLRFQLKNHTATGGGWINQTCRIDGQDGRNFFVKLNSSENIAMFCAEAAGLTEIAATHTVHVPKPIAYGIAGRQCYLVMEHLDLTGHGDGHLLGKQLAALHHCSAKQFGFTQDNFIGSTPQQNNWSDDWVYFWRQRRLGYQLQLASENGYGNKLGDLGMKLLETIPDYFDGYSPQPVLLHGDLWGGNHAYLADGTPAIFDPAVYYGDREADIAMTELFGGFSADFRNSYRSAYPLHEGYAKRRNLYNLYHILNHANMFGGSYISQAEGMMRSLLSVIH